jgi:uncharacterized protein (TIGR03000 family)
MYSVVLMAALAAGGEAPDWGFRGSHHAAVDYSCWHGGGYGSCYGCFGGGYADFGGGAFGGYGVYGCYGSYGELGGANCTGGYGIVGYASYGSHGCYGCYGCYGCTGFAPGLYPGVAPGLPAPGASDTLPPPKKEGETLAPNKARLIVELPPGALLYVDAQPIKNDAERRTFQTPELDKGQTYYYDLRVEALRDGKPVSENRRVVVRAGEEVLADFKNLTLTATAKAP